MGPVIVAACDADLRAHVHNLRKTLMKYDAADQSCGCLDKIITAVQTKRTVIGLCMRECETWKAEEEKAKRVGERRHCEKVMFALSD